MTKHKHIDWQEAQKNPEFNALFERLIQYKEKSISNGECRDGKEEHILVIFKRMWRDDGQEFGDFLKLSGIPADVPADTVVYEMGFQFGRADIVIFHVDGSATVIEVKDGTQGYRKTVSGIGQASLYSSQLGMRNNGLTKVRKALLWTSTGDIKMDAAIARSCIYSGTRFVLFDTLRSYFVREVAIIRAHEQVMAEIANV